MPHKPPLLPGYVYHIYNRGQNGARIFFSDADCVHFLDLMKIFICPIADVYSYALMMNHVHLAIRTKPVDEIGWLDPGSANSEDMAIKWRTSFLTDVTEGVQLKKPNTNRMFQHLFSAYSKWLNARYKRTGNLMEDRVERTLVESENQLRRLICYVNFNPEKHGVCQFDKYSWSSYRELIGIQETWLAREIVLDLFGAKDLFIAAIKRVDFDDWLKGSI